MSRPLIITSTQITAICKGAAKAGFIAEVEIDGVKIRLLPEHMASTEAELPVSRKGRGFL